ncbi:endoplasmic reticulum-Golgi intermediate compartment protein 3 [Phlebotomus argentipes]|uniref:endoplasmic reticulum-Golgi intermediate compartment protein 3 n=1 Tax=Phlebotomus argentipes TaxID=94469 RepID=UPI0028931074|nr:endoplasmic reticulum-Golgi intermediate compartment protein 3 [Phlebotomus argentipes]
MLDVLKRLDAYPKTFEEFSFKTLMGAIVTILSSVIICVLIVMEVNAYLTPNISEELYVDTTRSHKLQINLDITVPKISCDYLSVDAMDTAGEQHLHIEHNVYKQRLDLDGNVITGDKPVKEMITSTVKKAEQSTAKPTTEKPPENTTPACGSCYGAQFNNTHCCNTCQDVIDAYRVKRWNPNPDDFEQCKNERASGRTHSDNALKEGCQIYGSMEVNRMGGSFHLAPGQSFSINHVHIHDVQPYTSTSFNTSHVINHLSFGERISFANTHPLDRLSAVTSEGATMFQYYVKIVPTLYVKRGGEAVHTNQFSVTRHQKVVSVVTGESGMPGIFFSYELSPLMVKYTEKENSLGHMATNICAIVGGIYTVAGIFYSMLHTSLNAIRKKIELGKFS